MERVVYEFLYGSKLEMRSENSYNTAHIK